MISRRFILLVAAVIVHASPSLMAKIQFKGEDKSFVFKINHPTVIIVGNYLGRAKWSVCDFWNQPVANGILENGAKSFNVSIKQPGYYSIEVQDDMETARCGFSVVGEAPVTDKDSPFGVSTHFAQGWEPWLIPLIKDAGFSWIRDECYWENVERQKGVLDFNFTNAIRLKQASEQLNVILNFSYGNKFYDKKSAPTSSEGLSGLKNYIAATIGHLPEIDRFETWNEYNCGFNMYGITDPTPQNYLLLLKASYSQVKNSRSQSQMVGLCTATLPFEWIESVFALGGLKYMDAVSVHPYRWGKWNETPETLYADMNRLRQLVDKYADGKTLPIYATEVGWPVDWKYRVSSSRQADYIVRTYGNMLRAGVAMTTWYSFMKTPSSHDQFAIGDLVNNTYIPRPSYSAIAAMTRVLDGAQYLGEESVPVPALCLKFKKHDKNIRMLWNPSDKPLSLAVNTKSSILLTDLMGQQYSLNPDSGKVYIVLSEHPVYFEGDLLSIESTDALSITSDDMNSVINTEKEFKYTASGNLKLDIDGCVTSTGNPIVFSGNDSIGTRNVKGIVKAGGTPCGFFTACYSVLEQLSISQVRLISSDKIDVDFNNSAPGHQMFPSGISGQLGGKDLSAMKSDSLDNGLVLQFRNEIKNYEQNELDLKIEFTDHPMIKYRGMIGKNPCFFRDDIKIDADLSEWKDQPFIDLRKYGKYIKMQASEDPGVDKFSGKIWLGWNDKYLYIASEIIDETHCQLFPVWKGDSIQIGLGKAFPPDVNTSFEFDLAFNQDKKVGWLFPGNHPLGFNAEDVRKYSIAKNTRENGWTIYETAIPWDKIQFIKPDDGMFRFSILVNNNDGGKRIGWLEWGSGIGTKKDPEKYLVVNFVKN